MFELTKYLHGNRRPILVNYLDGFKYKFDGHELIASSLHIFILKDYGVYYQLNELSI